MLWLRKWRVCGSVRNGGRVTQGERLEIQLRGPFRLTRISPEAGSETIPVRSAKGKGLLALLAVAPEMWRSRTWLQSKLWSTRDPQQASSSLRQELLNLARLHPDLDDVLQRNRQDVALDPKRVVVRDAPIGTDEEFLSDVVVRDPAFKAWLKEARHARSGVANLLEAPRLGMQARSDTTRYVAFATSAPSSDPNSFLETTISHFVSRGLSDEMRVEVVDAAYADALPEVIRVELHATEKDERFSVLRISVRDGPHRTLIWSDIKLFSRDRLTDINDPDLLAYCAETVRGILDALSLRAPPTGGKVEAGIAAQLATRKLFSMNPSELPKADALFAGAFDRIPQGVFLAWRGLIRSFQAIERHELDRERLTAEAQEFCFKAQEIEQSNSMVLGLIASNRLITSDNPFVMKELADRSIRLNASNALAWDALASATLMLGEPMKAHMIAMRAHKISGGTPFAFWWDMGRAEAALALGLADEATEFFEKTIEKAPSFLPPRRYLVALHARAGNHDRALSQARFLARREADFSLLRMAEDPKYPISLLRKSGLLDKPKLRDLATVPLTMQA